MLALVATLAALAVVGRLAFAAIPNVKPTTDIVLFAGYALGAVPGFVVGAIAALVSNVFLVTGALDALADGRLGRGRRRRRRCSPARCAGASPTASCWPASAGSPGSPSAPGWTSTSWTLAAHQDLDSYLALSATSLPYNLAHAIGNVVFCLLIGPVFIRALRRYRRRFEVRWPAPPAIAATRGCSRCCWRPRPRPPRPPTAPSPGSREPRTATAASAPPRARRRAASTAAGPRSAWPAPAATRATCSGAAGARRRLHQARRRARSRDIGEIERTVLVLGAAGLSPRDFGGRDLIASILRRAPRQRLDRGLRELHDVRRAGAAVGGRLARQARRWRGWSGPQNDDGGFGGRAQLDQRQRHDRRDGPGARRGRPPARRRDPARRRLAARQPERRRRLRPVQGPRLERAVDGLRRAGPRRRRQRAAPRSRARSATCAACSAATAASPTRRPAPRRRSG